MWWNSKGTDARTESFIDHYVPATYRTVFEKCGKRLRYGWGYARHYNLFLHLLICAVIHFILCSDERFWLSIAVRTSTDPAAWLLLECVSRKVALFAAHSAFLTSDSFLGTIGTLDPTLGTTVLSPIVSSTICPAVLRTRNIFLCFFTLFCICNSQESSA